jgi:hypothetical protein
VVLQSIYFFRRYEITTLRQPHYRSATTIVHLAIDHSDGDRPVALKFMRNASEYQREIEARQKGDFSDEYVIGILRCRTASS